MSHRGENQRGVTNDPGIHKTISIGAIPDAVLIAESQTHEIVAANDAAGGLFNCQSRSLVGMSIEDLLPTDTPEATNNYVEAIKRGCKSERVNRLQNGQPVEIKTFDGGKKPIEINVNQILNADGEYLFGVLRDATEQVKREQELQTTTSRLETLLEALPIPVALLSPDGVVQDWNRAAEDLYGYSSDDVIGEKFSLFVNSHKFEELREDILTDGMLNGFQTVHQRQDGSHIDVELYARPLYEGEKLCGIIGAAVDITGKQRRIQQLEVLQRTLRHNIRNRLNIVQGHLEMIEEELDNKTDSINAAVTATDEILSRARRTRQIQTVGYNQDLPKQSISELVATAVRTYQDMDGLRIKTDVDDISVKAVEKFSTAIEHAIENAVEHTDPPVTVKITMHEMKDKIDLLIEDDGNGIPEEELQAVTAAEETPLEHGSGIGLWAMKWFTEQSGGRFGFKSDSTGTTIIMQLLRTND